MCDMRELLKKKNSASGYILFHRSWLTVQEAALSKMSKTVNIFFLKTSNLCFIPVMCDMREAIKILCFLPMVAFIPHLHCVIGRN